MVVTGQVIKSTTAQKSSKAENSAAALPPLPSKKRKSTKKSKAKSSTKLSNYLPIVLTLLGVGVLALGVIFVGPLIFPGDAASQITNVSTTEKSAVNQAQTETGSPSAVSESTPVIPEPDSNQKEAIVPEGFVRRTALNGKVSLLVPVGFAEMPEDVVSVKYPSSRRPTEVLSDPTGAISLAFNHTQSHMAPSAVQAAHPLMSGQLKNAFPNPEWIRDTTLQQNGKTFMIFEVLSDAADTRIHNIMYGTSVDNRFLIVAFNTTIEQSDEWLPIGKQIMESITINE